MKEIWKKVVELYRYWMAGRNAVNKAHKIINGGKTYRDMAIELKSLVEQYGIAPNEDLEKRIVALFRKIKKIDRDVRRITNPFGNYPPKPSKNGGTL